VIASTDLSEMGDSAIPHAVRWALDHGAALVLVHVLDYYPLPNPMYAHYYPVPTEEQQRKAEQKARAALRAQLPPEMRQPGRSSIVVTRGDPAREILRVANESASPAIVIASHGRTGIARLALGSVAERVLRAAHCPVLVVR
jgi:nucleotide-binding universal stress UspA family protein